ncbi:hypothetical protein SAMN04487891_11396 [Flagellimonas taeanensis]|uniref:Uncharacterized protein n=1 Tax=Flagellimonas taeanensis TaxID=1005926 RepID=A0A1M6ULI5_9FLAO|nr:hypothetical protein SAMN04487891_11396 [Allomuricauda taeanensis]SHK69968.1 hypothetical protein SAMN05216293_1670 [Allomuricauda taeanensis]
MYDHTNHQIFICVLQLPKIQLQQRPYGKTTMESKEISNFFFLLPFHKRAPGGCTLTWQYGTCIVLYDNALILCQSEKTVSTWKGRILRTTKLIHLILL